MPDPINGTIMLLALIGVARIPVEIVPFRRAMPPALMPLARPLTWP